MTFKNCSTFFEFKFYKTLSKNPEQLVTTATVTYNSVLVYNFKMHKGCNKTVDHD